MMSSDDAFSSDEVSLEEEKVEEEELSNVDFLLFDAVELRDAASVLRSLLNGANVNRVRRHNPACNTTPLIMASGQGFDEIVGILLDAGADARWKDSYGSGESAITEARNHGHLSTVQLLICHDNSLLELANDDGETPLLVAIDSIPTLSAFCWIVVLKLSLSTDTVFQLSCCVPRGQLS